MKALQITGPKTTALIEKERPQLENEDSVIVKIKCMGICGSDLHGYQNGPAQGTVIPGHEAVGVVVEKGSNVTKLEIGDHVVLEPLVSCGKCYACRKGNNNVCREAKCIGVHLDGGCQEYFQYDQDHWHKIPKDLPWLSAILIEPYTVGVEVTERGRVEKDDWVLIHGAGPAGIIAMDMAHKKGAKCIISEVVEGRLEQARALGAEATINPLKENLEERVMEITGEGPNVVIDAAGLGGFLDQAVKMVTPAGRIVVMGIGRNMDAEYLMVLASVKEVDIVGSRMQMHRFPEVIENCWDYLQNADKLVTSVFPVERGDEAFALAASAAPDQCKVVIEFED